MNTTPFNSPFRSCLSHLRPVWLLLVWLPFLTLTALGAQEGDFGFEIDGAGSRLIEYTGPGGAVVIPDRLGDRPVTSIGQRAFDGMTRLTSVTIPNSVTSIGQTAFHGWTSLTRVHFEGNRPGFLNDSTFESSPFVTIFHRADAAGWASTFGGRPTAVWVPLAPYPDWAKSTGLTAQYPTASSEGDDPDGDGLTNRAEWLAGTDPTQPASRFELESVPRPADLAESDRAPVPAGKGAVYFRSVPGRYYGVQRSSSLTGAWELQGTRVASASATQTRFVLENPNEPQVFYRVLVLP